MREGITVGLEAASSAASEVDRHANSRTVSVRSESVLP